MTRQNTTIVSSVINTPLQDHPKESDANLPSFSLQTEVWTAGVTDGGWVVTDGVLGGTDRGWRGTVSILFCHCDSFLNPAFASVPASALPLGPAPAPVSAHATDFCP